MRLLNHAQVLQEIARLNKKWCMYFSAYCNKEGYNYYDEVLLAAPYLKGIGGVGQIVGDGYGYLIFDTKEECYTCYKQTVGDDGPTKTNPYSGPARVYALTCDPDGKLMNENT